MLKRLKWIGLATAAVLLIGCGGGSSNGSSSSSSSASSSSTGSTNAAKWTYMVYIAGDNNLATSAIKDINEMETVGSSNDVNVVVQVEYSKNYTPKMPTSTLRGKIEKDNDLESISSHFSSIGDRDMGSRKELTEFVKWATSNYPADHYALVLWDHGAGWKISRNAAGIIRGALQDTSSDSFMSLPDLAGAIRDSGVALDIIDFDACLMAMYEVAYEFKGLAKYMTFSEESEPGDGNPYNTILQALINNPDMSGLDLVTLVPTKFKEHYQTSDRSKITKSSVDLQYVEQLHSQIKDLSDLFIQNIGQERTYLQTARGEAASYTYATNIDFGDFINRVANKTGNTDIKSKISDISNTLSSMIVANKIYSPTPNDSILQSTGLAIFIPQRSEVTEDEITKYSQLAINTAGRATGSTWGEVINTLIGEDSNNGQNPLETVAGNFAIWLEWDTDSDLDLIVWEPNDEFAAPYIGTTSTNGFLSDDSANSGMSIEYYTAAEVIQKGEYDIFVNYYEDGSLNYANASLYFLDPANGITEWKLLGTRYMNLNNTAPTDWFEHEETRDEVWNDVYSDWWWWYNQTYFDRNNISRSASETLLYKGKNMKIRLHVNHLPSKNSYKNSVDIDDETAMSIREQLLPLRQNMNKAQ